MAGVPHDPEALKRALALTIGVSPDECDSGQIVAEYEFLLHQSWNAMEPLVGRMGARAITEHSIKKAAKDQPAASLVAVTENGPDISALLARHRDEPEACLSLIELCTAVFLTMMELTGEVIAAPLLEAIARERGTDPGTG